MHTYIIVLYISIEKENEKLLDYKKKRKAYNFSLHG